MTEKGYSFVSIYEAMKDNVYKQTNNYKKKWGISWFYRWMNNGKEIMQRMKKNLILWQFMKNISEL